ncbi:hypothetical protein EVAR_56753_1 [Eumeta japonica]|uniref:Uncharacterized protein n=1 Tax=Eumeta variegata TaxID=151549 RepID=A0A4C1XLS9_EUMVA|nr:hypothetical protein EVAR_56753_1 [Eumeta japonica]
MLPQTQSPVEGPFKFRTDRDDGSSAAARACYAAAVGAQTQWRGALQRQERHSYRSDIGGKWPRDSFHDVSRPSATALLFEHLLKPGIDCVIITFNF